MSFERGFRNVRRRSTRRLAVSHGVRVRLFRVGYALIATEFRYAAKLRDVPNRRSARPVPEDRPA
jgi:hypothetical protein